MGGEGGRGREKRETGGRGDREEGYCGEIEKRETGGRGEKEEGD